MTPFDREPTVTGEWECMECGYIEEGIKSRRPAKCPECGAPPSSLEFFSYEDEEEWDREETEDAGSGDFESDYDDLDDEDWDDDER